MKKHYFDSTWNVKEKKTACGLSEAEVQTTNDIEQVTCLNCIKHYNATRDFERCLKIALKNSLPTLKNLYAQRAGLTPRDIKKPFTKIKKKHKRAWFNVYAANAYFASLMCVEARKTPEDLSSTVFYEWDAWDSRPWAARKKHRNKSSLCNECLGCCCKCRRRAA